jgi:hypothetical protein
VAGGDVPIDKDLEKLTLAAQLTAPASGLFLARVFYEGDDRSVPVVPVLNVSPSLEPDTASSREPSSAVGRRP